MLSYILRLTKPFIRTYEIDNCDLNSCSQMGVFTLVRYCMSLMLPEIFIISFLIFIKQTKISKEFLDDVMLSDTSTKV